MGEVLATRNGGFHCPRCEEHHHQTPLSTCFLLTPKLQPSDASFKSQHRSNLEWFGSSAGKGEK